MFELDKKKQSLGPYIEPHLTHTFEVKIQETRHMLTPAPPTEVGNPSYWNVSDVAATIANRPAKGTK